MWQILPAASCDFRRDRDQARVEIFGSPDWSDTWSTTCWCVELPKLLLGVLYTQSQVRLLLSISVETFRTWREAVPALSKHKGHSPTFTPGDVIALAVIAELVGAYGVRISAIAPRLDSLFEACRNQSWPALDTCLVILTKDSVRLLGGSERRSGWNDSSALVVACAPIVTRLRAALVAAEPEDAQGTLQFPLTPVKSGGRR